MGAAGTV